ncbi:glycosyltransferase [Paenibacillus sinopodophylli]|uniref:glycosyltransferase n=1 Tax=Paenibacillus sinopodophylli TaxID=1837342 RepID=UPI00110CED6C|nr:glycosyltransferase [Paenibacillus sinopodophylli]
MEIVLWTIAALLALQLLFAMWNIRQLPMFARLGSNVHSVSNNTDRMAAKGSNEMPLSILIPARNEEHNIIACLQSIQHALMEDGAGENVEVIVLDDRSEDGTARMVELLCKEDSRFKLGRGAEPPVGWVGKAYACHQLAELAKGRWLLFVDADARLLPGAVAAVKHITIARETGMISGFPLQQTESWLEKLIVPMMGFTIACHLPIKLVASTSDARFSAAHGAWIAISRLSYDAAGGHEASRGHLVDDVALMRAVKKVKHPVILADVRQQVTMRMYRNASEVWNGYKKNIYAGVGRSGWLLFAVLASYALLYLLPFAFIFVSIFLPSLFLSALTAYVLGVAVKATADRMQGQSVWLAWLIPFSILATIAIGTASWRSAKAGAGYVWKGRSYE